jgi:hypothetical protein
MTQFLKPGDDHNLLSKRTVGDPHPQYHHKGAPLTAAGPVTLNCPVVVLSDGCVVAFAIRLPGATDYTDPNDDILQVNTDEETIYQKYHLLPWWDYAGGQTEALYQCGNTANPWKSVEAWTVLARAYVVQSASLSLSVALTNNWDPTGGDIKNIRQIFRVTPTVAIAEVSGISITSLLVNMTFDLINVAPVSPGNTVRLMNEHSGSSAPNRIITGTGTNMPLAPNDTARLWYDSVSSRWRVLK